MSNSTRTIASIASAAPSAASMPNPQSSGNRLSARASTQQPLTDQVTSQESADSKALEGKVLTGKGDTHTISYTAERVIGTGSFGVVFQASIVGTGESVAIKKVLQDKRFKNRELQIMKMLDHGNIVSLKHFFYSNGDRPDEVYLNLVMDYIPETVYRVSRHYSKSRQTIPLIFIKLYMYQLFRSLAYLHSIGVCHRDIKPQNLLLDPQSGVLKLCDFGSAKLLIRGEPNVSYICSRYYRAPELLFGSTNYTTSIDVWSAGCVLAELLIGQPLFTADNGIDQLVEIIKVLGTPTREEITTMNPVYVDYKLPHLKPHPWQKIFRPRTPPEVVDFISKVLLYVPDQRLRPTEALAHPFFDELRDANLKLPTGRLPPPLFNFAPIEMRGTAPETIKRCVPDHALSLLGMTFTQFLSACTTAYSTASGQ